MDMISVTNASGVVETYTLNTYARSSDFSLMQQIGESVILATICIDLETDETLDFLPLSVQYIEKNYAIGRIPQGFNKKEGKPSEGEVLTSRLIDRSLRPLFPKDFRYGVQITVMVFSYDGKSDLSKDALNAASLCLYLSSIPLKRDAILNATRIVRLPSLPVDARLNVATQMKSLSGSSLDLFVSGIEEDLLMIEMQTPKVPQSKEAAAVIEEIEEDELLDALRLAKEQILKNSTIYKEAFKDRGNKKLVIESKSLDKAKLESLKAEYFSTLKDMLKTLSKSERSTLMSGFVKESSTKYEFDTKPYIEEIMHEVFRDLVLKDRLRADGRDFNEIRKIDIKSNILPCVHGSTLFTRGQTQALVSVTLGSENDAQTQESLSLLSKKRVMLHYNFPPFSVGEAMPIFGTSRRELGHGNLALKAIESNILEDYYIIRIVSEILESNGSSSMASVCGATLSLLGADVKMKNKVAGIAMGLVHDEGFKDFVILSDILGLEDHYGDMDFKVTGTRLGFSALQLDIKTSGLSLEVLKAALSQARSGLDHILGLMEAVTITPNPNILPSVERFQVPSNKIVDIIGQGGKTIRDIISRFNISIDIDKDNSMVVITSNNKANLSEAKDYIQSIIHKEKPSFKVGQEVVGVVKNIKDFGIFLEINGSGTDGLLPSKKIQDISSITQGQSLECVIVNINAKSQIELGFKG
ncbi:polyribonucleotide nucleotidyltransferase [Helicobacter sp. 11S02629-2]|uniref:polyribonucleotide nucleotidyltransferase n=1 Tax=Helicobacter sp. 11S02629-2 TaxID=1476195 RepID=UPI000BA7C2CA|nr:polyribonucleotide nucleotidyltransferase [Helicobacter sp. 11S02629-2]PAF43668.1 polyribonucleotide nucleotidyltransferase [Helicobacter sp. 11S02629-2]